LVIDNIDIVRDAPGKNVPYIVNVGTFVTDGVVTVEFVAAIDNPQINAIEVIYVGVPIPTPAAAPVAAPVYPTAAPLALPPNSPPVQRPPTGTFKDIFINCGGMSKNVVTHTATI
jgi:hypothetical protein